MPDQICPVCQQQNIPTATHCVHCGFVLQGISTLDRSTLGMKANLDSAIDRSTDCTPFLTGLSRRAILFLIHGEREPILFENAANIIIGRYNDEGEKGFFDMSRFGEVAMGISRRHARVTQQHGQFWLEDMGSTNGTWLNRQRLPPREPFPLTCGDVIHIGPMLKAVICFQAPVEEETVRFVLQPTAPSTLAATSIAFLATHVMTYLRAVETIQALLGQYQGMPPQPISLRTMSLQDGNYEITLADAEAAILLLDSLTPAWPTMQTDSLPMDETAVPHPTFTHLAANCLEKITSTPATTRATTPATTLRVDQFPFIEKLAAALATVAALPVRLSVRAEEFNDHSRLLLDDEW